MTAREFIAKFPDCDVLNENCLEDMACEQCGNRESFKIRGTIWAEMMDNGTERDESDFEFESDTADCLCTGCERSGKVTDFIIKGLDAALEKTEA